MKKLVIFAGISFLLVFIACDKVTNNAYPEGETNSGGLDWSLYPDGDSAHYAQNHWPTWSENTNTYTNALIEDFTGHRCSFCPNVEAHAHNLMNANPGRVFVAAIHTGATGIELQEENAEFPLILYCDNGVEIGTHFGSKPGTTFTVNPHGAVNRLLTGMDNTCPAGSWSSKVSTALNSPLKINLQAEHNYFPSTRGLFLHTEVDVVDNSLTSQLGLVVYLIEDSIIGPQITPDSLWHNYVHRDVLRGCIDNKAFGRILKSSDQAQNGKYYVNYAYKLPNQYDPSNTHLLIYVYDKTTEEIYQVIEEEVE